MCKTAVLKKEIKNQVLDPILDKISYAESISLLGEQYIVLTYPKLVKLVKT